MSIAQLPKSSHLLIEQGSDLTLLIFEREMLGAFDEQVFLNSARYVLYSRNKEGNIIKDDITC